MKKAESKPLKTSGYDPDETVASSSSERPTSAEKLARFGLYNPMEDAVTSSLTSALDDFWEPEDLSGRLVFGNYIIGDPIGVGGMGTVYLATHSELGTKLAVKVLHPQHTANPPILRRFIDEARAASAMEHENIIQVLDAGSLDDTRHYIAMEYLEGCTVADRIRRGSIDLREALTILLETAAGLEVAHEKGIIHRDLKPGNLFLQNSSGREGPTLKILDFGIAKLQKDDLGGGQTKTNTVLGTPHYMSPEQARALPDIDGRTDVYALGLIAYELYAGKRPYEAKSAGDLIFQMSAFTPSTLASICPHVPSVLSEVVQWAMSLEREARPPNVRMLAHALIRATPGGTDVAQAVAPKFLEDFDPHHWEFELRKKPLDRRIVVALLTTLTLGLGSLGVVSFNDWQAEQQLEASIAKEQAAETAEPNESSIESIEKNTAPTTPVPSPQSTLVRVESEPPGARVMIAGVLSGTTPTDVEATIGEPLRIALRLQGYEPFETAVDEVEPDLRISTSLAPLHTRRSGSSNRRRLRGGNRGKTQSTQSSEPSTMSRPPDLEDLFDAR